MSYFKIIHHSKLDLDDNGENLKVLCQKLCDKPFRTHVYFKPKQSTTLKELLRTENEATAKRIGLKILQRETTGLIPATS